jgi:hypothetical protein
VRHQLLQEMQRLSLRHIEELSWRITGKANHGVINLKYRFIDRRIELEDSVECRTFEISDLRLQPESLDHIRYTD